MELRYEEGGGPREGGSRSAGARGSSRRTAWPRSSTPRCCSTPAGRRAASGATSCASAASTARPPSGSASGSRRAGARTLCRHLRGKGFTDDELVTGGLVRAGQPRALRPVPRPAGLADPRHHRRHRRLRRAPALRRRPDRREVPQHLRDADLQEVDGALRPRRRQEGDLHRAPAPSSSRATPTSWPATSPASRAPSPPAARPSASTTSRSCGGSCATRPISPPAQRHLHLRRRRRRPEGRDEGLRGGPALGLAVVRRRRRRRAWTRASCASPRATPPCAPSSTTPCRCSSSRCARRSRRFDLDTAEGRVQAMRAVAPIIGSIRDTSRCAPSTPARCRAGSGSRSSRWRPRSRRPGGSRRRRRRSTPIDRGPRRGTRRGARAGAAARRQPCRCPTCATPSCSPSGSCSRHCSSTRASFAGRQSTLLTPEAFSAPAHRAVFDGIRIAAPTARRASTAAWVAAVAEAAPLAVARPRLRAAGGTLPTRIDASTGLPAARYVDSLVGRRARRRARPGRSPTPWPRCGACRTTPSRPHRPRERTHGAAPPASSSGSPCARGTRLMACAATGLRHPAVPDDGRGRHRARGARAAARLGASRTPAASRRRRTTTACTPSRPARGPARRVVPTVARGGCRPVERRGRLSSRSRWVDGERPARFVLTEPGAAARDPARAGAGQRGDRREPSSWAAAPPGSSSARTSPRAHCSSRRCSVRGAHHRPGGVAGGARGPGPAARAGRPRLTGGEPRPFS